MLSKIFTIIPALLLFALPHALALANGEPAFLLQNVYADDHNHFEVDFYPIGRLDKQVQCQAITTEADPLQYPMNCIWFNGKEPVGHLLVQVQQPDDHMPSQSGVAFLFNFGYV